MSVPLLNDINIYEGIVGAMMFPILKMFFLNHLMINRFVTTSLAWFLTWILRRVITNIVKAYKHEYNLPVHTYYTDLLPF